MAHRNDFDSDPTTWQTGEDPATDAQREYLSALAEKAGEPITDEELDRLTKAEASERIDELQR